MRTKHFFLFFLLSSYSVCNSHTIKITDASYNKYIKYNIYTLADILIEGKTEYNKKQILEFAHLKLGDKIQIPNGKMHLQIKNLWATNLFNNIDIYINEIQQDQIYLKIVLEDMPRLYAFKLIGIKQDEFHQINKNFHIQVGMIINKQVIDNLENNIKKYFNEQGYPDVIIYCKISKNRNKKNILNIHVNKYTRIKISQIIFEGNNKLSSSELSDIMKNTKKYNFFNSSKYIADKYIEDCNNIIDKYQALGFKDAQIVSDSIIRDNKNNFIIKIKIKEGKQFFIGKIHFVGNYVFNNQFLEKLLDYKSGDIYNLVKIKKNILDENNNNSILSTYLDHGYLFISINTIETAIIDNIINLEIRISEGKKFLFNKINFSGNTITKDHIIIRNITTHYGNHFSKKSIYDTLLNLTKLGCFESENIWLDIKPDLFSHSVEIRWKLFEKSANHIQVQGGYGDGKIIGSISLNFDNFAMIDILNLKKWTPIPQGDNEKISFFAERGSKLESYGFSFIKPWIYSKDFTSFHVGFNHSKTKLYDNNINKGYLKNIGIYLGINKKFNFINSYLNLDLLSNYEKSHRIKTKFGIQDQEFHNIGISNDLNYTIALQHISYGPDHIFPIQGSAVDLSCLFTLPYSILINNNSSWPEYLKLKIKILLYKNIFSNIVTKIGGEIGVLGSYSSKLIPFHRFYLGGTGIYNSFFNDYIPLRGYNIDDIHNLKNDIGGVIYNRIFTEFRFPMIMNDIIKTWLLCFLEAGHITNDYNHYNPLNLKRSIGIGIRGYMYNFGYLGCDLGYGFDNNHSQSKWKTHFIIGRDL